MIRTSRSASYAMVIFCLACTCAIGDEPPTLVPPPALYAVADSSQVVPTWTAEGTTLIRATITWGTVFPRPANENTRPLVRLVISVRSLDTGKEFTILGDPDGSLGKTLGIPGKGACLILLRGVPDEKVSIDERDVLLVAPIEAAPSPAAEKLLAIMEDKNRDAVERTRAASQLKEVADASCVDRLIALVPGEWDAMTVQIIYTLGEIGDKRALPVLERMDQDNTVNKHGKINVALDHAIKKLRSQK